MKLLLFIFCLNTIVIATAQNLSVEEMKLYKLIMKYRQEKGLPPIPLSKSLTIVAQTHVKDLLENHPDKGNCNMHSWSSKGKWEACCYTDDHAKASSMWKKPRELTSYQGNGYEIASGGASGAEDALNLWKDSKSHNDVIINKGTWKAKWQAIGIGINNGYAVVWFGNEPDTAKTKP